ncbi:hypothetical protein Tco_0854822, partial [Tanacetum coccineum]
MDLPHKINEAVRENVKERDEFLVEKDKSRKRRRDDQDPPPPPPDSHLNNTDSAHLPKTNQSPEWLKPIPDDERQATPKPAWVIPTSHIPDAVNNYANALATTYQAPAENYLLKNTRDMRTFMNWYCQNMGKTKLTKADLEGQAYEVVKPFYPDVVHLQIDISQPLPLSGPPGHVTIQTQFFFIKDLDYLRYGNKGSRQALSISKMKAARYHDFGLEVLVPEHMWIDHVCTYDISASYGHLNHLPGSDICFEFKHDYTIIVLPRAVVFLVSKNERKIMRFNEIYKFSDGTLTNIMEALDYRVKEYKVNRLNLDSRPEGSSGIWNALLVDGFTILTTDFFRERNDLFIPFI